MICTSAAVYAYINVLVHIRIGKRARGSANPSQRCACVYCRGKSSKAKTVEIIVVPLIRFANIYIILLGTVTIIRIQESL